jgi:hypothetical protein
MANILMLFTARASFVPGYPMRGPAFEILADSLSKIRMKDLFGRQMMRFTLFSIFEGGHLCSERLLLPSLTSLVPYKHKVSAVRPLRALIGSIARSRIPDWSPKILHCASKTVDQKQGAKSLPHPLTRARRHAACGPYNVSARARCGYSKKLTKSLPKLYDLKYACSGARCSEGRR